MEAWQEISELKQKIEYYNDLYYEKNISEITDFEFDKLLQRLIELETKYPLFASSDSPSQKVGGKVNQAFKKVKHKNIMQSLNNAFSPSDIVDFIHRTHTILAKESGVGETNVSIQESVDFVVEQKIDGLSVVVIYKDGKLVQGSTRGDGEIGEDITRNVLTIKNLPSVIDSSITYLELRGEVYMPYQAFLNLNEKAKLQEEKIFANPRNAAAGSLRQLDSTITAQRDLKIIVFNIQEMIPNKLKTHGESLLFLKKLGFEVSPDFAICSTQDLVWQNIEKIGKMRGALEYGIDGAVVKVNSFLHRNILGQTSKAPRWAIAYKYPPEQKTTQILSIDVQVGRTGKLTPVANLIPVLIAGSNVARATLNNEDYIKEKDIRVGDTVLIQKAGDVIPEVISVVLEQRLEESLPFEMPNRCPICQAPVTKEENGAISRCSGLDCPAQIYQRVVHFVSKDALDIVGLGPAIIEILLQENLISSVADLFVLSSKKDELLALPRMGILSVQNLLDSIEKSKNTSFDRLIVALGIRNVGVVAARTVAQHYGGMNKLKNASVEELAQLADFGQITAQAIVDFFALPQTILLLEQLEARGVNLNHHSLVEVATGKLDQLIFVITGTLPTLSRQETAALILTNGGKTTNSVSKKTNYVIAGEAPGSKLTKALELKIPVLSEQEFLEMIE